MALSEEQRKRMEENRKRALEIKRKKQLEKETNEKLTAMASCGTAPKNSDTVFDAGGFMQKSPSSEVTSEMQNNKKRRIKDDGSEKNVGEGKQKSGEAEALGTTNTNEEDDNDDSSLEDFERDASPYVSQTEAQRTYCLPKGTLDVCSYVERDNPRKRRVDQNEIVQSGRSAEEGEEKVRGQGGVGAGEGEEETEAV
eukprot:CAMPEP_0183712012 /NCGR_PEP_ID=MMETSP0737-20130205/7301_1 /TAXON_ID=385413 /ORGANISM="Thalassiosira miniscula, Strain CCMP1093" /LENGTH=196 /DNA_ID=CAMNT_0025940587 /DNA_START=426 /DNA_END=1015 /DNA_ORIENTATION=-